MINQNCENFNCILHKKCPFYEACECDEIKCNYEYDCENCEHPAQCDKESEGRMKFITCEECLHKVVCPICFSYKDVLNVKDYCEHFADKSALEKQIPKNPIDNGIGGYICPHCNGVILDLPHEMYHRDCGGRLERYRTNCEICLNCAYCDTSRKNDLGEVRCKRFSVFVKVSDNCQFHSSRGIQNLAENFKRSDTE